jgi:hypothetical protein
MTPAQRLQPLEEVLAVEDGRGDGEAVALGPAPGKMGKKRTRRPASDDGDPGAVPQP